MFNPWWIHFLHVFIVAAFTAAPAVAPAAAIRGERRGKGPKLPGFVATLLMGLLLGLGMCIVYAVASSGSLIPTQILLAGYFATALLVILKAVDALFSAVLRRIFSLSRRDERLTFAQLIRVLVVALLRLALLAVVVLPYAMTAILTYHPKVVPRETPATLFGVDFERVTFSATDGTEIVGWWIPPVSPSGARRWGEWGENTVIVCHDVLAANKSNQLLMCRQFIPAGFNVLTIDFRAHGESGGQLTTFGDLERRDVLGAVRWVKATHPNDSKKIFGVGASMGGAALIAAAADDSPEGRAINAIATYAAYGDMDSLAATISAQQFVKPFDWLMLHVAYPLASPQCGADLAHFSPADLTNRIWPRPILFIHGLRDEIIDFHLGQDLYNRAPQPKVKHWVEMGFHNDILEDDSAAKIILEFFKTAEPVPII